ncbi:hypothetical protein TNCV_2471141 [Trichonephila clavipes]|nr:hypothetical protein TNCV_2471141 [Trichonephila clavipes]
MVKSATKKREREGQILLLGGACKDLLPAPGNRSNETHDIERRTWQRERREGSERGEKESGGEKTWSDKGKTAGRCETFLLSRVNEKFTHFCIIVKKRTEVVCAPSPESSIDDMVVSWEEMVEPGHHVTWVISVKKLDD